MSRRLALLCLVPFFVIDLCPARGENPNYVIQISVDGLGSNYLRTLLDHDLAPNFQYLIDHGASTLNARSDYDITVTLPNHVTMATARPVMGTDGHNWSENTDPSTGQTIHTNKGSYVASVFDVAHDNGMRTGLFVGKSKLSLLNTSYDSTNGADDTILPNYGKNKVDTFVYNTDSSALTTSLVNTMTSANPCNYAFVHYRDPDAAGGTYNWGTTEYYNAIKTVDGYLGTILNTIQSSPTLNGHTTVILTADHGGPGTDHSNAANPLNYTIPFVTWGAGVSEGRNLYTINEDTRQNPGAARPGYAAANQPVRNADGANLALDLLNLSAIPGSTINSAQNLAVYSAQAAEAEPVTIAHNDFTEQAVGSQTWTPSQGQIELGFYTTKANQTHGDIVSMGAYNSPTSPQRFRMRTVDGQVVFDQVNLAGYRDVTVSIDVLIKSTTYEAGDYYRAVLTNGTDSIDLAWVEGAGLNALAKDMFINYTVAIPNTWTTAQLILSSFTNSSEDAESVDFDNIYFQGVPVPEPTMLLILCTGVFLKRRTLGATFFGA